MFDTQKMTGEEAKGIINNLNQDFYANITKQQMGSTQEVNELVLDLSVARTRSNPLEISYPFMSCRVEEATDPDCSARILLNTVDDFQKPILLRLNDSLEIDRGIRKAYIYNTAQAGKFMIIKFFTSARVRSGQMVLNQDSVTENLTIGEASAQNDGLTLLMQFPLSWVSNSKNLLNEPSIYNDSTYKTGRVLLGTNPYSGFFQVPIGFTAELLGAELLVVASITSASWELSFHEIIQSTSYADAVAIANSGTAFAVVQGGAYTQSQAPFKATVLNQLYNISGANPDYSKTKRIITSGKALIPIMTNFDVVTGGGGHLRLLIRLTRNVGA